MWKQNIQKHGQTHFIKPIHAKKINKNQKEKKTDVRDCDVFLRQMRVWVFQVIKVIACKYCLLRKLHLVMFFAGRKIIKGVM